MICAVQKVIVNIFMQVEAEVSRLEELKSSKMKELVLKKRAELEEICQKTHLIPKIDSAVEHAAEAIESGKFLWETLNERNCFLSKLKVCIFLSLSGAIDPACVLEQLELQIASAKEEAFARKEIIEKVEKWLAARDEESWLEEYNMVSFFIFTISVMVICMHIQKETPHFTIY